MCMRVCVGNEVRSPYVTLGGAVMYWGSSTGALTATSCLFSGNTARTTATNAYYAQAGALLMAYHRQERTESLLSSAPLNPS